MLLRAVSLRQCIFPFDRRLSLGEAFEGEVDNKLLSFLAMRHYVSSHHVNLRLTMITPATLENLFVVVPAV